MIIVVSLKNNFLNMEHFAGGRRQNAPY